MKAVLLLALLVEGVPSTLDAKGASIRSVAPAPQPGARSAGGVPDACTDEGMSQSDGWLAAAAGSQLMLARDYPSAVVCLRKALRVFPESGVIEADLGGALAGAGMEQEAAQAFARARRLGAQPPDLSEAIVLMKLGQVASARMAAQRLGGIRSLIFRAASDDQGAILALGRRLEYLDAAFVPIAKLVLAQQALKEQAYGPALSLASEAELAADEFGDAELANVARRISSRARRNTISVSGRLRLMGEHMLNPDYRGDDESVGSTSLSGEAWGRAALGVTELQLQARIDKRLFFERTDELRSVERGAALGEVRLLVPLSADLRSLRARLAVFGLTARSRELSDLIGSDFRAALGLEWGFHPLWWGELEVAGAYRDYPNAAERTSNRDRVGQRVRVTVRYEPGPLVLAADVGFSNDESSGRDFDAIGFGAGLRAIWGIHRTFVLRGGAYGLFRRFGPFGDSAVSGVADRARELRVQTSLEAVWLPWDLLHVVASSRALVNTGEVDYIHHLASLGIEVSW